MLVNMKEILEIAEKGAVCNSMYQHSERGNHPCSHRCGRRLNTPIIIDHAQVHDPLIPIERIGPENVKICEGSICTGFVYT